MTPAQLCGFVDSLIIPVTQLNDPHAIDLLHQISYQSYCLLEGGDIDINKVKDGLIKLQAYLM